MSFQSRLNKVGKCAFGYVSTSLHILHAWSSRLKEKVATTCWIPTAILCLSEVDGHTQTTQLGEMHTYQQRSNKSHTSWAFKMLWSLKLLFLGCVKMNVFGLVSKLAPRNRNTFTPRFPGFLLNWNQSSSDFTGVEFWRIRRDSSISMNPVEKVKSDWQSQVLNVLWYHKILTFQTSNIVFPNQKIEKSLLEPLTFRHLSTVTVVTTQQS